MQGIMSQNYLDMLLLSKFVSLMTKLMTNYLDHITIIYLDCFLTDCGFSDGQNSS